MMEAGTNKNTSTNADSTKGGVATQPDTAKCQATQTSIHKCGAQHPERRAMGEEGDAEAN